MSGKKYVKHGIPSFLEDFKIHLYEKLQMTITLQQHSGNLRLCSYTCSSHIFWKNFIRNSSNSVS